MNSRRSLPLAFALLLLVPTLAVPWARAAEGDEHYLNLNQVVAQPGAQVGFTVSGRVGEVAMRVDRLVDPTEVRDFQELSPDVRREKALERTIRIPGDQYAWSSSWSSATETLTLERPGIYVVETSRGEITQRAWLQVTTHSFIIKHGPTQAVLYAFALEDGRPLAGGRVVLNGTDLGATGPDGLLPIPSSRLDGPIVLLADGTASAGELGAYGPMWYGEKTRVVVHTDRAIYRPGQTAHVKVMTFERRGERFVPFDADAVRVRVTTWARGNMEVIHEATLEPNDHGSAALSIPLAEDARLGRYSIQVQTASGLEGWAGFQVDAYKKPRIQVDVEPARDAFAAGDEVLVLAKASWFFGAPLNRGAVSYRIVAFSHSWGCPYCGFSHDARGVSAPITAEGSGALREDGTFVVSWDPGNVQVPTEVRVTVSVTAESGERQEGEAVFTVHPAALAVDLSLGSYVHEPGKPVRATATVRDLEGRLMPGVPVELRLVEERGDVRETARAVTDPTGRAHATLVAPTRGGSFLVVAAATDTAGRKVETTQWTWISDSGAYWSYHERLTLLSEKPSYAPGETARVLVLVTEPSHVLVTFEGRDLYAWRHVYVERSAFVEFPVGSEHAPHAVVAAMAFRSEERSHSPQVAMGSTGFEVGLDPRLLNVTITPEKPAYRDGDATRLLVQLRDSEGRPVQGEVALSVVDEAIFALAEVPSRPLSDALYPERPIFAEYFSYRSSQYHATSVQVWYPWWTMHLKTIVGNATTTMRGLETSAAFTSATPAAEALRVADDADGAMSLDKVQVKVREDFPDTALWLPFLRTDATGTARVQMTAPDTLTEWRVTGVAHTLEGLVGEARASFHTRKPLMVELSAPRFLVQGDAPSVNAVVFNHVGEMRDVEVQLVGEGAARLVGPAYRRVTLSDGDSVRLDFPILATDDASAIANLTAVVRSVGADGSVETDAMRLRLPVLPHGVVQKAVRAGADDASFALPVPPGPYAAQPKLVVTLTPSMAGAALDALPYLLGFPYGCVEQTMSRFMPAVVATRALVDAGYDAEDPLVPQYVEKGLERLMRFQHSDGGWGWWEGDATHPYMTAYVVAGLAEAERAGVDVDDEAFRRGIEALRALHATTQDPDMRAYQAYALALAGAAPAQWPDDARMSSDGVALLGLAKLVAGDREGAQRHLDRLMERAIRDEGRLHWAGSGDRWGSHGIRSDVQLTAHALRLMVALGRDADAPLAVSWLAQQRQGAWWHTTKDTSESILAIVDYLRTVDELNPDYDARVTMGGETFTVPFHGDAKSLTRRTLNLTLPEGAGAEEVRVEIDREGEGRLYWSAVLSSVPRAETIPAESRGITVEKHILDEQGREVSALVFDEEYTIVLDVTTPAERHHVLLHDPLPAGVEVVPSEQQYFVPWARGLVCWECGGWTWPWSNAERRDDHVASFATTLPTGSSSFSYRVRAVHPGAYHVLPATVEEMYAPDVRGRSGELHVAIGDVPRLLLGDAIVAVSDVSLRVFPAGGATVRPSDVEVDLVDAEGAILPLASAPQVVLLEDGSLNVSVAAEVELPPVFSVSLRAPTMAPATRTFDRTGQALRFDGAFDGEALAAWSAGEVVDATTAQTRSAPGDPSLFVRPEQPPGPVDPQPEPPGNDRWIPGPGALLVAVAVLCALPLVRRRRG